MTLEDTYFIASIIAAVGVTASLVFVGLQVRQSARTAKAEMQVSLISQMPNLVMSWHLSDRTRGVDPFGEIDMESLSPDMRGALMTFYFNMIKFYETSHYQLANGFLDEETWLSSVAGFAAMSERHPARQYWYHRRVLFPANFRAAMDDVMENHPQAKAFRKVMQEARGTTNDVAEAEKR